MVLKKQLELEAIIFVFLGAVVGFILLPHMRPESVTSLSAMAIKEDAPTPTPALALMPLSWTDSQISSDGKKTVILKTTQNNSGKTFELSTSDSEGSILTKTLPFGDSITIPFNTWSSDNQYFFINQASAGNTSVFVFKADGTPFAGGQPYLDLTGAFTKYGSADTFDTATGWAEGELIVINTKQEDGSQGTSYWYEVPDQAIIPLATKF